MLRSTALRYPGPRTRPVRLLDDRDRGAVVDLCDTDPVANVFVSSRVRASGLDARLLGAQVWGHYRAGELDSVCYSGANLVPVAADAEAIRAFAACARDQGRRCSSVVGPADAVKHLWELLGPAWGPARVVRAQQPVMTISGPPRVAPDRLVRRVMPDELDILLPASVAMFTEEVGISPCYGDGGAMYRARVAELIGTGRAFARIEDGEVVFKAEIGAVTPHACQVQGVWVRPGSRGRGLASTGMAAVVEAAYQLFAPLVTLYVNDFNAAARSAYRRTGFAEAGTFMSVLF